MLRILIGILLLFSISAWADECADLKLQQKSARKETIFVNVASGEKACYERCIDYLKLQHNVKVACGKLPEGAIDSTLEENWENSCKALVASIVEAGKEGCRVAGTPSFNCYFQEKPAD